MEKIKEENKSEEKCTAKITLMTDEAFDELWNLEWAGIPDSPYILKYKFDEDGYTLMVSDLTVVYGEKLNEKAIQERFQILNPYAEMLPKVILKHLKQAIKNILTGEQEHNETELKITLDSKKFTIQYQFNISGVRFIFNFEPQMLSDNQFKTNILRPMLLRALILHEEKATFQRKIEELEGKQNFSSSSNYSGRRNIKAMYSEIKESHPSVSGILHAFLYLQKDKVTWPDFLEASPNVSPLKRAHSSSASSTLHMSKKDSKSKARSIPYNEDDSNVNLETQNIKQQSEAHEFSIKTEKIEEDDELMNDFDNTTQNGKESNKRILPVKSEISEEDNKEDSATKPTPYLKPPTNKKKKLLKF